MAKRTKADTQQNGDYNELLDASWDDLPSEILLPDGDWELRGKNASQKPGVEKEDGTKTNGQVLMFYKAVQPVQVADADIEAMGDYDFKQNDLGHTIWIDKASAWKGKVGPHLQKHGIEPSGHTIPELLKAFAGSSVIATVGQRTFTSKGGETVTQNTLSNFRSVS